MAVATESLPTIANLFPHREYYANQGKDETQADSGQARMVAEKGQTNPQDFALQPDTANTFSLQDADSDAERMQLIREKLSLTTHIQQNIANAWEHRSQIAQAVWENAPAIATGIGTQMAARAGLETLGVVGAPAAVAISAGMTAVSESRYLHNRGAKALYQKHTAEQTAPTISSSHEATLGMRAWEAIRWIGHQVKTVPEKAVTNWAYGINKREQILAQLESGELMVGNLQDAIDVLKDMSMLHYTQKQRGADASADASREQYMKLYKFVMSNTDETRQSEVRSQIWSATSKDRKHSGRAAVAGISAVKATKTAARVATGAALFEAAHGVISWGKQAWESIQDQAHTAMEQVQQTSQDVIHNIQDQTQQAVIVTHSEHFQYPDPDNTPDSDHEFAPPIHEDHEPAVSRMHANVTHDHQIESASEIITQPALSIQTEPVNVVDTHTAIEPIITVETQTVELKTENAMPISALMKETGFISDYSDEGSGEKFIKLLPDLEASGHISPDDASIITQAVNANPEISFAQVWNENREAFAQLDAYTTDTASYTVEIQTISNVAQKIHQDSESVGTIAKEIAQQVNPIDFQDSQTIIDTTTNIEYPDEEYAFVGEHTVYNPDTPEEANALHTVIPEQGIIIHGDETIGYGDSFTTTACYRTKEDYMSQFTILWEPKGYSGPFDHDLTQFYGHSGRYTAGFAETFEPEHYLAHMQTKADSFQMESWNRITGNYERVINGQVFVATAIRVDSPIMGQRITVLDSMNAIGGLSNWKNIPLHMAGEHPFNG